MSEQTGSEKEIIRSAEYLEGKRLAYEVMDLRQLYELLDNNFVVWTHGVKDLAIAELVKRAKMMDKRLATKEEPHRKRLPMPTPVYFWLQKCRALNGGKHDVLFFQCCPVAHTGWDIYGPFHIIPGMMSLDELAKYDLFTSARFAGDGVEWCVETNNLDEKSGFFPSALHAQWAATQLAKEAGHGS